MTAYRLKFNEGDEVVYSSSLDVFGKKENIAMGKCVPATAKLMEEWGWDTRLKDLSKEQIKHLILTHILEFEQWMKDEMAEEKASDAQMFLDIRAEVDLEPPTEKKNDEPVQDDIPF